MAEFLVLHGPNLNLLGTREPAYYGRATLEDIDARLSKLAAERGYGVESLQSNAEHELIEAVHRSAERGIKFIVLNPAAYTHTSVALRDALAAVGTPFVEVHLSNVHAREPFRHRSYFSDVAHGVICGLGPHGYELALLAGIRYLESG